MRCAFRSLFVLAVFHFRARMSHLFARKAQRPPRYLRMRPYKNTALPVEKRVADLLSRMTLEEKATMLSGSGWMESAADPAPRHSLHQDGRRPHGRALLGGQFGHHQFRQRIR